MDDGFPFGSCIAPQRRRANGPAERTCRGGFSPGCSQMLWTTGCPSLWTSRWNPVVAGARAGLANFWPTPRRPSSSGHLGAGDCLAVRGTGLSAHALHTLSSATVCSTTSTRTYDTLLLGDGMCYDCYLLLVFY